jgi:glucosamine--fructose-6-phosphate aminotransferase (isomerizing)
MTSDRPQTDMAREIAEIPEAAARFLETVRPRLDAIGGMMRETDPPVIVTCARGSSDHAAGYLKYCCEIMAGIPVASIGPSVASIYEAPLKLGRAVLVAISQSGMSPDIVALAEAARQGGARTVAIVNNRQSDLAAATEFCLPIAAGEEKSVAATKTFIVSGLAALALLAVWRQDRVLLGAIDRMPETLEKALALDWSGAVGQLAEASSLYVLGRGPGYPIAQEAALKFKETASLHAEAHSGAEVMHGPLSLVRERFPVLALAPDDASREAMRGAIGRLGQAGAQLVCVENEPSAAMSLPYAPGGHPLTDPLSIATSFYRLVEAVAAARGIDPDNPINLKKVTETV